MGRQKMNEAYRFSPILEEEDYKKALVYIATRSRELAMLVLGRDMPVDTLTIFSHFPDEYIVVASRIQREGEVSKFSHGKTLYIDADIEVEEQRIIYLGVRKPDPTRPQVGYADFPVLDYCELRDENIDNIYVRKIQSGLGQDLLEIWHPNFDVLGYVVDAHTHLHNR
jgi:hypothetical protein